MSSYCWKWLIEIYYKLHRDNARKPSTRDIDTISENSSVNSKSTMNSNRASDYNLDASSSRFSSALSRLKYSDYKPLMRTFTRRFESPPKVNIIKRWTSRSKNYLKTILVCSTEMHLQKIERKHRSVSPPRTMHPNRQFLDSNRNILIFWIELPNESKNSNKREKIAIRL